MPKYRRIEVNAYRRRVTIVSGEWPAINLEHPPAQTEESVSLGDSDSVDAIEPDSPEGQEILVEAVRSLERRLSPEAMALIRSDPTTAVDARSNGFYLKLQSLYLFFRPRTLRFSEKEERNANLK